MDAVTVIGLAASLVQLVSTITKTISILNEIRKAPKERAELGQELATILGLLTGLRYRVESCKPHSTWFAAVRCLGVEHGPVQQLEEVLMSIAPKLCSDNGLKSAITWPFHKKDAQKILGTIERIKSIINLAYQEDLSKLVYSVKVDLEMLGNIDRGMQDVLEKVDNLVARSQKNEAQLAKQRLRIINWMSPLNFYLVQDDILRKRAPGTGQYAMSSDAFSSWLNREGQTLWCHGIPGAGKTVFAATAVDHLRETFAKRNDIGVAVVYCNYKEQYRQSPEQLLAGIWRQLIQPNRALSNTIRLSYKTHQDRGTSPSIREISQELHSEVANLTRVYIIVDALDECATSNNCRMTLLQELRGLLPKVNIMVTSRILDDIKSQFQGCLQLRIEANHKDVESYILSRISQEGRLHRHVERDPALQDMIIDAVLPKTQKMFLLAQLHMDLLATKATRRTLEAAMKGLPKELDLTYDEAMKRIADQNEDDRELAWKILSWIALARRPLKRLELQHALAVEVGDENFDDKNVPDEELLTSLCAGLVIIDAVDETVVPIHYTTQEYFERVLRQQFGGTEVQIAAICLTYLSFKSYSLQARGQLSNYPFYPYAVCFWMDHFTPLQPSDQHMEAFRRFIESKGHLQLAVWYMQDKLSLSPGSYHWANETSTALHIVARYAMDDLVQKYVDAGLDINAKNYWGDTTLHVAVRYHNISTIYKALENKADINAASVSGMTPLHHALQSGNLSVSIILLDHGARVDLGTRSRWTALHFAALGGDVSILSMILAKSTDVNATTVQNHTPLYVAVKAGREEAVKFLITHDASVNIAEMDDRHSARSMPLYKAQPNSQNLGNGRTPLHIAAAQGNCIILEGLLNCFPDIEREDGDGYTAVRYAIMEKHSDATEMLLRRGAQITPSHLYIAVEARDTATAEILAKHLENSKDLQHSTCNPLIPAITHKNEGLVLILLRMSSAININGKDAHGASPLHAGAISNFEEGVRLLLEAGADYNIRNNYLETPLHPACEFDRPRIVEQLLSAGINVNAQDLGGETALHRAAAADRPNIIRLLLKDEQLDLKLCDRGGNAALHAATKQNSINSVICLLDEGGVDVDARDEYERTALVWAAEKGFTDVVRLLIGKGADVNSADAAGETALHRAAANDYTSTVRVLLANGADTQAKDVDGETPKVTSLQGQSTKAAVMSGFFQDRSTALGSPIAVGVVGGRGRSKRWVQDVRDRRSTRLGSSKRPW